MKSVYVFPVQPNTGKVIGTRACTILVFEDLNKKALRTYIDIYFSFLAH